MFEIITHFLLGGIAMKKRLLTTILGMAVLLQSTTLLPTTTAAEYNNVNVCSDESQEILSCFPKCSDTLRSALNRDIELFEVIITYSDIDLSQADTIMNSKVSDYIDEEVIFNLRTDKAKQILSNINANEETALFAKRSPCVVCVLNREQIATAGNIDIVQGICLNGELSELANSEATLLDVLTDDNISLDTATKETGPDRLEYESINTNSICIEPPKTQSKNNNDSLSYEQNNTVSTKALRLICKNEDEQKYPHGSIIRKEFELQSDLNVDTYDISVSSCNGVQMIKEPAYTVNENDTPSIVLEFKVLDSNEIGNISFRVSPVAQNDNALITQKYFEQNVYCYNDGYYDLISTVCLDCLECYSEKLQKYLLELDRQGEYIESDSDSMTIEKNPNSITDSSAGVSGYISWTDGSNGVHSADGILVELYKVNGGTSILVDSTNANQSGGYSCSFVTDGSSQNVKLKVVSQGTNVTIKNTSNTIYSYETSVFSVTNFATMSYTASNSTNAGKSVSILQALTLANNYIYSLESSYLNNIDVIFPNSSGTYFTSTPKIYLEPNDEFDWDVAQHEYGHYVQYCYNIANSPGGSHTFEDNLADDRQNKSAGIRLAWGEGWATYFALNLQKEMNASYLYIPNVGDTHYQDIGTGIDLDLELLPSGYWKGEANEATVCAVLYDMTDVPDSSEGDNVWFANDNIWAITKNNNCTTLSEFLSAFYVAGFEISPVLNLGSTLSRYKVAADPSNPTGLNTNTPTFYWSAQGGSVDYPNNSFRLVFYDSNLNYILSTSYTSSTSQTLTSSQWTQIKNASTVRYYYVETEQTNTPSTGPYKSILKQV